MTNILTIFDYLPILIWAERGSLSNGVSFRGRTRPKLCLSRLKSRETKAPGALRVDCADSRFLDDGNVLVSWSLRFFWKKNHKIKSQMIFIKNFEYCSIHTWFRSKYMLDNVSKSGGVVFLFESLRGLESSISISWWSWNNGGALVKSRIARPSMS